MQYTNRARGAGDSAAARFTGSVAFFDLNLGLAPQALFCHLLRRFSAHMPSRACFAGSGHNILEHQQAMQRLDIV
jgi:hypothetical protein